MFTNKGRSPKELPFMLLASLFFTVVIFPCLLEGPGQVAKREGLIHVPLCLHLVHHRMEGDHKAVAMFVIWMLVTCALPAVGSDSEHYSHVIYTDPRYKVCTCAIQLQSTHFVLCGGIPNTPT